MASFKSLFGGVPSTAKVEQEEAALIKDYNDFQEYTGSDELKRYKELDQKVNSQEFALKKKEIMGRKFKATEEFKKEQEYLALKKSKEVKNYYKVKGSKDLEEFKQTGSSDDLKQYEELNAYVNSEKFASEKQNTGKEFKNTEAYNKQKQYLALKKSPRIRKYFKFRDSPLYKNYQKLHGSDEIIKLEELGEFIASEDFRKVRDYMSLSGKKKYEQSEEYALEQEYHTLKKSDKINWYFRLREKNEFHRITDWELTFEDDFGSGKLDAKKWMTNYFWGDVLLKDTYALPGDRQLYTDGKNLEFQDNTVRIVTKSEKAKGKIWNPVLGFRETEFDYTSGLISTGKSFRQKYGKFRAKIKLGNAPVRQAGWMLADSMLPHLDLVKCDRNRLNMGLFWGNPKEKGGLHKKIFKTGGEKFTQDFFIYEIDWSDKKITWSINGKNVLTQTENIPQDPMYLVFSAGVTSEIPENMLPSGMELDYVKVYRRKTD